MQRKKVQPKLARGAEVQTKGIDLHDHRTKSQEYLRKSRFRRGEGSKSSPTTTRARLKTPALNLRSRSEGNLIAAQLVDLKSGREVEDQHEKTLQLPKLGRDFVSSNATLDHELHQKKSPTAVKETSSSSSDNKSGRFAVLRYNEHRRMFKEHVQKEENEYEADKTKRDILLKWLSEQNFSDNS